MICSKCGYLPDTPNHELGCSAKPSRPTWDETWLMMADVIAKRSRCAGRQVGAIIVDRRNRLVASGFNGPPANYRPANVESPGSEPPECHLWCERQMTRGSTTPAEYGLRCPSIHAEANALLFVNRSACEGGTIYVSSACCAECGKLIANSGLVRVVMRLEERDSHRQPHDTVSFMRLSGITVEVIS